MKLLISLLIAVGFFAAGCGVRQSVYKRFPLPRDTDAATAQRVFNGVVREMRTQEFVDAVAVKFPTITAAHWAKTDIRFEWVATSEAKTYFVSFGVKDTSGFQDAAAFIDFAIEYGKREADQLLRATNE